MQLVELKTNTIIIFRAQKKNSTILAPQCIHFIFI